MEPRSWTWALQFLLLPGVLALLAQAQGPAQQPSDQSAYSFHTDTHVVLTDVTVSDAKGNPVRGLRQSAFHIFDNKKPQVIASFEEHTGEAAVAVQPTSSPGVYSNDYLLHLPPALNIVLIDIASLGLINQMYLADELTRFLNERPVQPLAIYLRAGSGCFLVQNFTSDPKLLLNAVDKAIPRFPPTGREYLTEFDTLNQIAGALSQLPGRKNLLWFSGGSNLFLNTDLVAFQNDEAWRGLYDALDQDRIAVYPIDARGVIGAAGPIGLQHIAMDEVAQSTGGRALYNNNGLKEVTEHLLDEDGSFYTLTYSPHNLRFDNKWHKIRVAVDGASYQLSYRSGYFADGSVGEKTEKASPRAQLLANGEKLEVNELREHPIIFEAHALPEPSEANLNPDKFPGVVPLPPQKGGSVRYMIRYSLPVDDFKVRPTDGKKLIVVGVAAAALSRDGAIAERNAEQIRVTLPEGVAPSNPGLRFEVYQRIDLSKGDAFLRLTVWDTVTGRFGSTEAPVDLPKPGRVR
jgi:VWFA-related protein